MQPGSKIDLRLIAGVLLLAVAAFFTWKTIDGLAARRQLRMELAELSHVRYGVLNADQWVERLVPILNAQIDGLDLTASSSASLKPTVEQALYRLLDSVKAQMTAKPAGDTAANQQPAAGGGLGGFLTQGNPLIVNMIVGALRPHVPEYADTVLAELGRPENKEAVKNYLRTTLKEGAKNTFGKVDMTWYSNILKQHGCTDAGQCRPKIGEEIRAAEASINSWYLTVLAAAAAAFLLLLTAAPVLRRPAVVVLMLFCVVLLCGGVLSPMIEVEAKLSSLSLTILGKPVSFGEQVLYFQSKSVLEVFHTLVTMGEVDMFVVGVLVLMFSVVFPTLKTLTVGICLFKPSLMQTNRLAKFFALESSKWSMADVMALAIFMSFVAFNGLIGNAMQALKGGGAELVIPTNSSKILPGYELFIGFCLAGLFLSRKLAKGIQ